MGWSSTLRRRLARARGLAPREWWTLLEAWLWLGVAWLGLRVASLERVSRLVVGSGAMPDGRREPLGRGELERLGWLVAVAARTGLVRHTCLPRSLVLARLLRRRGVPAELRIGVRRDGETIAGHAWVEVHGEPVGEPGDVAARFRPLRHGPVRPSRAAVPAE